MSTLQAITPVALLCCIFTFFPSEAQNKDGTNWINPTQTYVRIPVSTTGMYRVTGENLSEINIDISEIQPASLQLFRRGSEVAIEVVSQSDEIMRAGDHLIFYGERNDGKSDSVLYKLPHVQPHQHYSLYTDTASYFLTWRKDFVPGTRMSKSQLSGLPASKYHFQCNEILFTDEYPAGNIYPVGAGYDNGTILSGYDEGEGWTGRKLTTGKWHTINFELESAMPGLFSSLELVITGRNPGQHLAEIWVGESGSPAQKLGEVSFKNYETARFNSLFNLSEPAVNSDSLSLMIRPMIAGEEFSVSFTRFCYPELLPDTSAPPRQVLQFDKPGAFRRTPATHYYDVSEPGSVVKLLPHQDSVHHHGGKILTVPHDFVTPELTKAHFPDQDFSRVEFLILTHPLLRRTVSGRDPVQEYSDYRSSAQGGNYRTLILNADELFNLFHFGERSPQSIRNALRYLKQFEKLQHVLIIGKSIDPQTARKLPDCANVDMIPNAGWPGSDIALSMNVDINPAPMVPVGRINTDNPDDVLNYLNKVKEHEIAPVAAPWRKKILHLSGGHSPAELFAFRSYLGSFSEIWSNAYPATTTQTFSKQTVNPVEIIPIADAVNEGAAVITLFGHSGLNSTDLEIGRATDPDKGYRNQGRYPLVIANGCALGNIYYALPAISNDWILAPEKGAVLFLAHTFNGLTGRLRSYTQTLYEVMADPLFTTGTFGNIQQETIRRYLSPGYTEFELATAEQMNLQGDPAIRIFPAARPDYSLTPAGVGLSNQWGAALQPNESPVQVAIVIKNYGRKTSDSVYVTMTRTTAKGNKITAVQRKPSFTYSDTLYWTIEASAKTIENEEWHFVIDPDNLLDEEDKSNNTLDFKVSTDSLSSLGLSTPLVSVWFNNRKIRNQEIIPASTEVFIYVTEAKKSHRYKTPSQLHVLLRKECPGCVTESLLSTSSAPAHPIRLVLPDTLTSGLFNLGIKWKESDSRSDAYHIQFRIEKQSGVQLTVSPNPATNWVLFDLINPSHESIPSRLLVTDYLGRIQFQSDQSLTKGPNAIYWFPGNKTPGVYLYRLKTMPAEAQEAAGTILKGKIVLR